MRWTRWLGLAGVVGIAATGVVVVRADRARRSYTPEEIRDRLHARLDARPDSDGNDRPEPA